jgi:hypothetical protein
MVKTRDELREIASKLASDLLVEAARESHPMRLRKLLEDAAQFLIEEWCDEDSN